jgi:hypothetical protein
MADKALTKQQKECVRAWLLNDRKHDKCPFLEITSGCPDGKDEGYPICAEWFPKSTKYMCPCSIYEFETVVRRAKKMVE